jgi:hypothetical protein
MTYKMTTGKSVPNLGHCVLILGHEISGRKPAAEACRHDTDVS